MNETTLPPPDVMCDCGGDYYTADTVRALLAAREVPTIPDDAKLEVLIEATDATWHEDVLHIEGPALMDLLRRAAALSAAPASPMLGKVEGWKLVPIEATEEMIRAAMKDADDNHGYYAIRGYVDDDLYKTGYAAMVGAAPEPHLSEKSEAASDLLPHSWIKAAEALTTHWKARGPAVSPQWCSDANRLLEFGIQLATEKGAHTK